MTVILRKLKSGPHKFSATFDTGKTVKFGAKGYEDYTIHKDKERYKRYLDRHRKREDWTRAGRHTPGFWSRWLLWSEPSFRDAIKVTEGKLGEKITYKR
jgi:hypothetical protein